MVADRAGTSGSCQALLMMMMRGASPVGRRIGQMQHAGFEQVGFHFVPVDLGTRRKAPPLFSSISVQLNGLFMISQSRTDFWYFHRDVFAFCFGFLVEVGRNLSVSSFR